MTASVVLDDACRGLRRRLGSSAWLVLEEAALTADESESPGVLWTPLSVRSVAGRLGMGRGSAASALSALVAAGLLRSAPGRRSGGRFGVAGYWLTVPEGMTVIGVSSPASVPAVTGQHGHGAAPAKDSSPGAAELRAPSRPAGAGTPRQSRRHHSKELPAPAVQASLFVGEPSATDEASASGGGAPPCGMQPVGACERDGCELVDGVHELAPGVPGGADPHSGPSSDPSLSGAGSGC